VTFARGAIAIALLTAMVACDTRTPQPQSQATPPPDQIRERDLILTFGGWVNGGPEDQQVKGVCGSDYTRNVLHCDIYNGLRDWQLTEVTIAVTWAPYGDDDRRDFAQRVSIQPLTTSTINIRLGMQLPADTRMRGTVLNHWGWQIVGAKALSVRQ